MELCKATAEDAQAIWDLRNSAILAGCKGFYDGKSLARWTEGELTESFTAVVARDFYVMKDGQRVVGSIMLDLTHPGLKRGEGQLEAVFVDPDMMGRGIGKRLMTFIEQMALSRGIARLRLASTLNAVPFYRACGYGEETPSLYHSPRGFTLDCCLMYKNLTARP
ncbi:GNAT family N-acetyltransferase [Shewanella litorisediminis]|uniref:GNAT family N-acetyltransferase n=1 Tax=Shewanella litorisediminis TaxID=1173586 RepID=A0ABX7G1P4_9GAMM|nr:GNAT family N-acetyltransferase [Shewanella litorisediminis]MCL2918366.1 GNAT family N-acetyltransferase [Shewanella litorisediminis]QRH01204.1 GNAT family N-acetyltransferase [Shewanella litorisediminis]